MPEFFVRGLGVILMTVGALSIGSLVFSPELTTPTSTVLGVVFLLGGVALFVLGGRRGRDS